MRVVLLNGPPYSGKDEAAKALCTRLWKGRQPLHMKFSQPLKDGCKSIFRLTDEEVRFYESSKEEKERARSRLMGMSWRQAQIWLSEEGMKPKFREDVFGKLATNELDNALNRGSFSPFVVFSDCGFSAECAEVVRHSKPNNILLIRLHRDGSTYTGDSRSYIELPTVKSVDLWNKHTLELYQLNIRMIVGEWLGYPEKDWEEHANK